MLRNHLKIALRSALKQKGYTVINLFGLIVGLASFIIIILYVFDEHSYDKFHADADRIHRVVYNQVGDVNTRHREATPGSLKDALISNIPEIEKATHFHPSYWGKALLENDQYSYYDKNLLFVDNSFLDVFSFSFIQGNPLSALIDPASVVLTESTALRFFGEDQALGQTLTFNSSEPLKVTGIIKDIPVQSHISFDFLIPLSVANRANWENSWGDGNYHTYIKVKPQTVLASLDAKIQRLIEPHQMAYMTEKGLEETYFTQTMTDIHLNPFGNELTPSGNKLYVQILSLVALFILLIAGINYVNLSTARSSMRSKEIGLRKVVGVLRKSLIYQFLTESILTVLIAGVFAVGLALVTLPFFNNLMGKDLSLLTAHSLPVWGLIALAVFVFGLAAGLYPAFFLSGFKPIAILKNQNFSGGKSISLRKSLVIIQFALTAFLLIGMLVVKKQMAYIQNTDLGFDKDQIIVIDGFQKAPNRDENYVIREEIEALSGVLGVGGTVEMEIGLSKGGTDEVTLKSSNVQTVSAAYLVDDGFLDVFNIELTEGRNLSRDFASDKNFESVIINEAMVKALGIEEDAIGQTIIRSFGEEVTVVGVVKDFQTASLHEEIAPLLIYYSPRIWHGIVKLAGGNIQESIAQIKTIWNTSVPGLPLDYYFIDDAIDRLYKSEQNFSSIFSIMTGLILTIACLGLFGLAAYTAEQRTKEIGIRKVLGASVSNVVTLLSKEFVTLVLIANIIAWPVAWFAMSSWLDNFAYRTTFGASIFLFAGILAILIAGLAVGWQTVRAAVANPVDSLKSE